MNEETTSTAPKISFTDERLPERSWLKRSAAVFAFQVVSAATLGAQRCFLCENTAETQVMEIRAESSTQERRPDVETLARLDAMLSAARRDIIEDGRDNAVTEQLPDLFTKDFNAVVPALMAVIESGRALPIVSAELLKELGRIRDAASHNSRRWLLEWALNGASPFIRDGAALGLARLADPAAINALRRAVNSELNTQTRADLQLVLDELEEIVR